MTDFTYVSLFSTDTGSNYGTLNPVPVAIISGGGGGGGGSGNTDSAGSLLVDTEGQKSSYVVSGFLTPASSPTDILSISGSSSKTVRIKRIHVTSCAGTIGTYYLPLQLLQRSSANVGGTSTNPTPMKLDSNNGTATAVVAAYTANPSTLGTLVGVYDSDFLTIGTSGSGAAYDRSFGTANQQSIVLRGASQYLAINLSEQASTNGAGQLAYSLEFSEE